MTDLPTDEAIRNQIHVIRGHPVLLHNDLARLYGVTTPKLLATAQRFPGDFCYPLERLEILSHCSEPVDSQQPLYGFTEHGAMVLAYVLNTARALAISTQVLRAFELRRRARVERDPMSESAPVPTLSG